MTVPIFDVYQLTIPQIRKANATFLFLRLRHPFIPAEYNELIKSSFTNTPIFKPLLGFFFYLDRSQYVLWRLYSRFKLAFSFLAPNITPELAARIMAFKLACGHIYG
jgi:hypothetical protein